MERWAGWAFTDSAMKPHHSRDLYRWDRWGVAALFAPPADSPRTADGSRGGMLAIRLPAPAFSRHLFLDLPTRMAWSFALLST
jgi:hypothetical protein